MAISPQQIEELRSRGLSDTQIQQISGQSSSEQGPKTFGGFVTESVPHSLGQFVTDVASGAINILNPNPEKNTLANVARLGVGGVTKLIPGDQGRSEQFFNDALDFYKDRYGGGQNIKDTLYSDPVGGVSDFALFLTGAGSAVKVAGTTSRLSGVARVGEQTAKFGNVIDPARVITSGIGAGAEKLTEGRNVSLPGSRGRQDLPTIAAAKRTGVDTTKLPASAVTDSRVLTAIEAYNAKGLFGNKALDQFTNGMNRLNSVADDFVRGISVADNLSNVGDTISAGIGKFKSNWTTEKNRLYGEAADLLDKVDSSIELKDSVNILNNLIEEKKLAAGLTPLGNDALRILSDMRDKMSGVTGESLPTIRSAKAALKEINEKARPGTGDPVVVSNQAAFRAIAQSISNDIDRALAAKLVTPEGRALLSKIDAANKLYQEGLEKMNSSLGKKVKRLANEPSKIVDLFLAPSSSVEDIIRMMQTMGPEAVQPLRRAITERIFAKARNAEGNFTPEGLNRELKKLGREKMSVLFDETQVQMLDDLDVLSQSMGRVSKVMTGSQTAFMGRIAALVGTFGLISPLAAVKLLVGDFLFGKFIESPTGQQFLRGDLELGGGVGKAIKGKAETVGTTAGTLRQVEVATQENDNR